MKSNNYNLDWDKIIETATSTANMIKLGLSNNSFVNIVSNEMTHQELINELIVCSISESPDSTKRMFCMESESNDEHLYIRMLHDYTKKCNRLKNSMIFSNRLNRTDKLLEFIVSNSKNDNFMKRTSDFMKTLIGRDKVIFGSLLGFNELSMEQIANDYGLKTESVIRAKNRLIRRYKDYMNLITYYSNLPIEHISNIGEKK